MVGRKLIAKENDLVTLQHLIRHACGRLGILISGGEISLTTY
jgi:hypothetical protein